jgi:hypothetical protein
LDGAPGTDLRSVVTAKRRPAAQAEVAGDGHEQFLKAPARSSAPVLVQPLLREHGARV